MKNLVMRGFAFIGVITGAAILVIIAGSVIEFIDEMSYRCERAMWR